jgi:hypothetical protein
MTRLAAAQGEQKSVMIGATHLKAHCQRQSKSEPVERQPPCPRATTILAGFQAAEVGVSFNVSG